MKKITLKIFFAILLVTLTGCQKNFVTSRKSESKYENKYENLPMCTNKKDEREGNFVSWVDIANELKSDKPTYSDYQKALCLYQKVLKVKDIPEPKYNIGIMYLNGQGVDKNVQQAMQWFLNSDSTKKYSFEPACFALGMLYFSGKDIPQDYDQAIKWLEKAGTGSFRGYGSTSANAFLILGQMHYQGLGTAKNNQLAFAYFWFSSLLGNKVAKHHLDIVQQELSKTQLDEAMQVTEQLNEKYHVFFEG